MTQLNVGLFQFETANDAMKVADVPGDSLRMSMPS